MYILGEKAPLTSSCPSICQSHCSSVRVYDTSASFTEVISVKIVLWNFYENMSRKSSFGYNRKNQAFYMKT